MQKLLSIAIPVYNQVALCRECLSSLRAQTFQDFEVILVDDGSSSGHDYRVLLGEFSDLTMRYERNSHNLGAIRNIFHTILYPVQTRYIMSMHEDDLLHPEYLRLAVQAMEASPRAAFIGANGYFFDTQKDVANPMGIDRTAVRVRTYDAPSFVRYLLQGNAFMLASVVYRTAALSRAQGPDLVRLSTACDRPFLVELLKSSTCLAFAERIFFSRRHGKKDMRGKDLNWEQIFALYEYYKAVLPQPLSAPDEKFFIRVATNDLLLTYRSLFPDKRPSFFKYIRTAKQRGLFVSSSIRLKGLFGLLSVVIGSELSFYLFKILSKLRS